MRCIRRNTMAVVERNVIRITSKATSDGKGRFFVASHTAFGSIGLIHGHIRGCGTIGAGVEVS